MKNPSDACHADPLPPVLTDIYHHTASIKCWHFNILLVVSQVHHPDTRQNNLISPTICHPQSSETVQLPLSFQRHFPIQIKNQQFERLDMSAQVTLSYQQKKEPKALLDTLQTRHKVLYAHQDKVCSITAHWGTTVTTPNDYTFRGVCWLIWTSLGCLKSMK